MNDGELVDPVVDPLVDPEDLADDPRAREALRRFRVSQIGAHDRDAAAFDEAYGALDLEFGARGELERRDVVSSWLAGARGRRGYKLLVVHDEKGALAAVRDCHVVVDDVRGVCVVYLAHALVLPSYRRSGVAAILRAAPITLGRHALAEAAHDAQSADLILAAEMDLPEPNRPETIVRLVAYGRAGFAVIAPRCLPYCQPDFRDLARLGVPPRPIPMLAVVRRVGRESEGDLPADLAAATVRSLHEVFATHCRPQDLEPLKAHALATLASSGLDRIPLLALPRSDVDLVALEPLWRTTLLDVFRFVASA